MKFEKCIITKLMPIRDAYYCVSAFYNPMTVEDLQDKKIEDNYCEFVDIWIKDKKYKPKKSNKWRYYTRLSKVTKNYKKVTREYKEKYLGGE